jgi:outer membrane protein OmpU
MYNFKNVGLTALGGSLAAVSADAAGLRVSGATLVTYTSEDPTETTGNPYGMKTNLGFTASGEVNGYTVSYMQTSKDQFAGMSSARLSIDMGDMGVLAFDQGSGSGLATIDDKTPTAAEEIWDGIDSGATTGPEGLVGAAGNSGVWNYVKTMNGVTFNGAARKGSGTKNSDGSSSGSGQGAWDFALTADGSSMGMDGLSMGAGYGEADVGQANTQDGEDKHNTVFANYSFGPATVGAQRSRITKGTITASDETTEAWGIAFNVNDDLSISYGEREVEFDKVSAANVTEEGEGIAVAYTMGSIKIAGNMNEVNHNDGTANSKDEMTEIALSFAF